MLNNRMLISVIVPVYNAEKYLQRCVDSILSQTFSEFEVILMNDGSTDSSQQICNTYAASDSRIRVINQINQGVSAARNRGLKEAKGTYIAFIDADDYLDENYLQTLYHDAEQNDADIVCCDYWEVVGTECFDREKNPKQSMMILNKEVLYGGYAFHSYFYTSVVWGKIIKKDIIKKDFLKIKYGEDTVFVLELYAQSPKVYYHNYKGYYYVRVADSATMRSDVPPSRQLLDHLAIGKILFDNIAEFGDELQARILDEYAKIAYYSLINLVTEGSKENYNANMETLQIHIGHLLKNSQIKTKYRLFFKLFHVSPSLCWWIMDFNLKVRGFKK